MNQNRPYLNIPILAGNIGKLQLAYLNENGRQIFTDIFRRGIWMSGMPEIDKHGVFSVGYIKSRGERVISSFKNGECRNPLFHATRAFIVKITFSGRDKLTKTL